MKNQEKRKTFIIVGFSLVVFNAFMWLLTFFEPNETNKHGIAYVQGILDATFVFGCIVIVLAHVFFPKDEDDPEDGKQMK